jgi:hypothetical protein
MSEQSTLASTVAEAANQLNDMALEDQRGPAFGGAVNEDRPTKQEYENGDMLACSSSGCNFWTYYMVDNENDDFNLELPWVEVEQPSRPTRLFVRATGGYGFWAWNVGKVRHRKGEICFRKVNCPLHHNLILDYSVFE